MGWFTKKEAKRLPSVRTEIGEFFFVDGYWRTSLDHLPILSISCERLDLALFNSAEELLKNIERKKTDAIEFARTTSPDSLNPIGGTSGEMPTLEEVDLTDLLFGDYALTFGFTCNADNTTTVEFKAGKPVSV